MLDGEHRNYNLGKSPWKGKPLLDDGHGTSVAGLVGAIGGNALGSRGVAYGAKMAGFRYIGITQNTWAKMIDQANGNFDIFNYSYGLPTCAYRSHYGGYIDQLRYGVTSLRSGKGAIYVKSAGNDWLALLSHCDSSKSSSSSNSDDWFFGNAALYANHNWPYLIVGGGARCGWEECDLFCSRSDIVGQCSGGDCMERRSRRW